MSFSTATASVRDINSVRSSAFLADVVSAGQEGVRRVTVRAVESIFQQSLGQGKAWTVALRM